MKTTILAITLLSTIAFSAEGEKRNETRTRTLGESILQVSACAAPEFSSEDYNTPMVKQDGTISTDQNGNIRYVKMTRLTARTSLAVSKCQNQEQYMVEVAGSMWNSKSSEIPGSAKAFGQLANQTLNFSQSQEVNLKKLIEATNNGGFWGQESSADLIMNLAEGLKKQVKEECEQRAASLRATVVSIAQTACK